MCEKREEMAVFEGLNISEFYTQSRKSVRNSCGIVRPALLKHNSWLEFDVKNPSNFLWLKISKQYAKTAKDKLVWLLNLLLRMQSLAVLY